MSAESYIVSTTKSQPTDASVVDASGIGSCCYVSRNCKSTLSVCGGEIRIVKELCPRSPQAIGCRLVPIYLYLFLDG